MKVLITAAVSAQAQQLKNVLALDDAILGDYLDIPDMMLKTGRMVKTPNPRSTAFIHQMLSFCLDKQVFKVYPLRRAELVLLAEARQLFEEFDIMLMMPSKEIIDTALTREVTIGELAIVENGRIVEGDFLNAVALLHDKTINGVFKVNAHNYTLFTAD